MKKNLYLLRSDNINESKKDILDWQTFEKGCQELANKISDSGIIFKSIITFPRGGFPVATRLSHLLNINDVSVVDLTTPIVKGCLVVDDISDTGNTLNGAKSLGYAHFATLHWHRQSIVKPTWFVWEKKDDWIVYPWEV